MLRSTPLQVMWRQQHFNKHSAFRNTFLIYQLNMKYLTINIVLITILFTSCQQNTSKDTKSPKKDTLIVKEAKNVLNEILVNNDGDSIIYDTHKDFNKIEAENAKKFVFKIMKINKQKIMQTDYFYNKKDDSYIIQVTVDIPKWEVTHSTFYKYYPKTQTILDGLFYDTLYHNKKMYPKNRS